MAELSERLPSLLSPASVAVIGASEDPRKMGGAALRNLLHFGYKGAVYPVNKGRTRVAGLPSYGSVGDCPGPPETAIVAVPAAATVDALAELGAAGVRTATVVAAGFSEGAAGDAGQDRTRALAEVVRRYDLTILGPNTTGLANLLSNYVPRAVLNSPDDLTPGPLAIVAQSGALSNTLMCRAQQGGVGVGLCVATGDEFGVRVDHLLHHLAGDPGIGGVLVALESVRDGDALAAALTRLAEADKPVIVLPAGRTDRGRQMAQTHTGALTGDSDLLLATLAATGAVVTTGIDQSWQAWRLIQALRRGGAAVAGRARPPRVAVVAFSGGEATILADRYGDAGVGLPEPSAAFADRIARAFSFAQPGNPFDLTGEGLNRPDLFAAAVTAALAEYDLVHFAFPVFRDEIAEGFLPAVGQLAREHPGRLLLSAWPCRGLNDRFLAGLAGIDELTLVTESERVPELLAVALPGSWPAPAGPRAPQTWPATELGGVLARLPAATAPLAFHELRGLVTALGCDTPRIWEAERFLAVHPRQLPVPAVYLKGYRPGTVHKAREGLVRGPLRDRAEVADAAAALRSMPGVTRVEVEQEVRGLELIVAAWHDPAFGAGVTVGLGGALTELLAETVTFSAWDDPDRLRQRFWASRVGRVVRQHCGPEPGRLEFVLGPVLRLRASADLLVGRFAVVEINPLVVDRSGGRVCALDAVAVPR